MAAKKGTMSAKKASPARPKAAKRAAPKATPRKAPAGKPAPSPEAGATDAQAPSSDLWPAAAPAPAPAPAPAAEPASQAWPAAPAASGWSSPQPSAPAAGWTGFSAPATGWSAAPSTGVVVMRPSRGLLQPMVVLLAASIGLSALTLLLEVLFTDWGTPSASAAQTAMQSILAVVSFGVSLGLIIVFCMWLHRTLANAKARHPEADVKPGWAVGSFFIPVAHLFLPYFEVRRGWTADVSQDAGPVTAWFVPWALAMAAGYVTAIIAAVVVFQTTFAQIDQAQDPQEVDFDAIYDSVRPLELVAGAIGLALNATAAFFLARMGRQWTALQEGPPVS